MKKMITRIKVQLIKKKNKKKVNKKIYFKQNPLEGKRKTNKLVKMNIEG